MVIAGFIMCVLFGLIMTEVMHRTMASMLGAALCLIVLAFQNRPPSLAQVVGWMDHGTLGLLWGMMLIVGITMRTGVFEWTGVLACKLSKGDKTQLLLLLCTVTAVLSAFLDNVTTILLICPVTCKLCKLVNMDPRPYLISEAIFSNLGGTATMIGDPPNIIIGNPPSCVCNVACDAILCRQTQEADKRDVACDAILCPHLLCLHLSWRAVWRGRGQCPCVVSVSCPHAPRFNCAGVTKRFSIHRRWPTCTKRVGGNSGGWPEGLRNTIPPSAAHIKRGTDPQTLTCSLAPGNMLAKYLDFNAFLFNLGPGVLMASPPVFYFLVHYYKEQVSAPFTCF